MRKGLNWLLLLGVVVLAVLPLLFIKDSDFSGSDGVAEEAIKEVNPDYQPWFHPLIEPPGGETESLLFAVQAAAGAGFIGYALGVYKGRLDKSKK